MVQRKGIIIISAVMMFLLFLGVSSLFLTAPGVKNSDIDLSFRETNSAKEFLNETLSEQVISVGDKTYKASDLGVSYDSEILNKELSSSKMWNFSQWGKSLNIPLTVDEDKLKETLSSTQPEYKNPVNASVSFNGENWVVSPEENGNTLSTQTVIDAFLNKKQQVELEAIPASISTQQAEEVSVKINGLGENAKIVDKNAPNNVRPLTTQEFASFITISPELKISANKEAIQLIVEQLSSAMNKEVKNGVAVVNENNEPIHTLESWQDGYEIGDTSKLAENIAANVESLSTSDFLVEGKVTTAEVEKLYRRVEVDLAARRVYTYENEKLVKEYQVAIGAPSTPTFKGSFHVRAQVTIQNMGCFPGASYCTKDVKWVSYFNGDQGFHGTYWHNDFGNPNSSARSHGCINMTESDAYEIYKFVQNGTPVLVR